MSLTDQLLDLLAFAHAEQHAFIASLPAAERDAAGTVDRWSAKDNLSHAIEWNRRILERLETVARGQPLPSQEDFDLEHANAEIFAQYRHQSWEEVRARLDTVHAAITAFVQSQRDDGLRDPNAASGRQPWQEIAGSFGTHTLLHLISYLAEHGRGAQAVHLHESLAAKLGALDQAPEWRGAVTYNLACAYAIGGQKQAAVARLKEALQLRPDLTEWSKEDPDFASIREDPAYRALYE